VLKLFATPSARMLPDPIDLNGIFAWAADTRGDGSGVDEPEAYLEWLQRTIRLLAEECHRASRATGRSTNGTTFRTQLIHMLLQNKTLSFEQAHAELLALIAADEAIATDDALQRANQAFSIQLRKWLDDCGITYCVRPHIALSNTELVKLLRSYPGTSELLLSPSIPSAKEQTARANCKVPEDENIAALIDCTFFGQAHDAILFGRRGVYHNNGSEVSGFIPYAMFGDCLFTASAQTIDAGHGHRLSLDGSSMPSSVLVKILEAVRELVLEKERPRADSAIRGLAAIPGLQSLKTMLINDVIGPLQNADEYRKYKLSIPNGVLLYGPPGCGKTFIARKLADELTYNFHEISPASVASPYIHETSTMIGKLFEDASRSAPSIIFVDEFEGLVPVRGGLPGQAQFKAEEVNEWLVQLNDCAKRKILFIAATNEPWKIDPAVLRTGRLDKKMYVSPPDLQARIEILGHHLEGRPIGPDLQLADFCINLNGYSASDLKVLADEAARLALHKRSTIGATDLVQALSMVRPSISRQEEEAYRSWLIEADKHA
jgi:ATP-dependent 26S proteasome regulatory subunit